MLNTRLYRKSSLALGIAFALYGNAGFAQESSTQLEEIVVTGSLIKGTPEDSAQPVEVITEEELNNLGRPSNLDLVRMMSEQGAAPGEANRFNAFPVGAATVNLRNLGSRFTTVVFNNRRFPEQFAVSVGRFNNINWIPNAAVGRIEVLKQGGAVTYGADAVGGVVNYITKKDLEGFEANVDYRYIQDSNGDYNVDLSWGKTFDRGNFMVVGGYQHRSALMAIDRPWSQTAFLENKTLFNWSANGSPGSYIFQRPFGVAGTQTPITPAGAAAATQYSGDRHVGANGAVRDPNCTALGGFSGWSATPTPVCYLQTAQFENLVEESNQYQLYMEFNLQFADSLELHTEGLYYQQDLPNLSNYPGDAMTTGGFPMVGTTSQSISPGINGYFVPGQNPAVAQFLSNFRNSNGTLVYGDPNVAGTQANAIVNGGRVGLGNGLWRAFGNGGNPAVGLQDEQHNNTKMYRLTTELKGELPEFWGTSLDWTTAVTYSQVHYSVRANDMLVDRLQAALNGFGGPNCTGATAGAGGCLWFNPFSSAIERNVYTGQVNPGYVGSLSNSADLVNWMRVPIELTREYEYVWFDGLISGKTGIELPGGPIAAALGIQGRYASELFELDNLSNRSINPCATPGVTTCTGTSRTGPLVFGRNLNVLGVSTVPPKRKYPVGAVFFETQFPIIDSLDFQLAGRYEKFYSDVSDKDNSVFVPAGAIKWQPLDWLSYRISAGKTFSQVNPPIDDGPTVAVVSAAAPNTAFGGISGYNTANYDNVDVQPMKSQYISSGFLFQTAAFTANIDYWYIGIDDYTRTMNVNNVLSGLVGGPPPAGNYPNTTPINCASPLLTTPVAALGGRPFVQLASCGPGTTLSSLGVNTTTINFFGTTNETNSGTQRSSGIDVSASYRFDDVLGGRLTPSIDGTYNLKWTLDDFVMGGVTVAPGYDGLGYKNSSTGRIGVPIPEWRGSFGVLFSRGKHTFNLITSYIPSVKNEDPLDFDTSNDQNANIGNASGATTTGVNPAAVCTVTATGLTSNLGGSPAGAGTGEYGGPIGTTGGSSVGGGTSRGFCNGQNVAILSGQKIESSTNVDLTYRLELSDTLSMSLTIYNLLDDKPSFDRATVAYNSGFGSPLERNIKLGFKAKF